MRKGARVYMHCGDFSNFIFFSPKEKKGQGTERVKVNYARSIGKGERQRERGGSIPSLKMYLLV